MIPVWYAIPSCNRERALRCFEAWADMGYRCAVHTDADGGEWGADARHVGPYRGYWTESNHLARMIGGDAAVVVFGGDDILPDPKRRAEDIALEFVEHFKGTFGVMQPTGDPWMPDKDGVPASARICGSGWYGRDWIARAYGGRGPTWPDYHQFFADEEVQQVALRLGVFWQRPDLTQLHLHWSRTDGTPGVDPRAPYQKANSDRWWQVDKALFELRRSLGWPSHQVREL